MANASNFHFFYAKCGGRHPSLNAFIFNSAVRVVAGRRRVYDYMGFFT